MENKSRFDSRQLLDNREIRIFLSSTFSDMQEERSALVKTIDKLKIDAMRRNVTLSLLDLRWGVTDEEARTGKVISVCLNEIERSHPFFIGLLGCHYGTSFDSAELEKNPDLTERYPWIKQDIGSSITEIEMLYGVLRNTEKPVDAAFYIKDTTEPDDNPRQTALKNKIRDQKGFPVEDYSSIEKLCTLVEREVTDMLNRHFPDGDFSPLERERTAHRAFINIRHNNFVGREGDLKYLDWFAASENRKLVITGDSGMGKSALLAKWIKNNEKNSTFNIIYHFVGNSFSGNSYESILWHISDEIYDIYGIEKTSERKEQPEEEVQSLIDEVGRNGKPLVIVIDGINQMVATTNEKLLLWLPDPNNKVKFVFTTLQDDTTMQALERRGYEVYKLGELSKDQRMKFAIGYLENVGKHMDDRQLLRIIEDPANKNTLVLRTLLDELICFGSHEHLNARIDYYLDAANIYDFFDRMLQRMEDDYDNSQDLVKRSLALIALSEHGLSVDEIIAITGFRPMDWHRFYCAFFNHLVVKEGLVSFSHQYVAAAVVNRYATENTSVAESFRLGIVVYFTNAEKKDKLQEQRCISELAHQYYHLANWDNLHKTLLSFNAFRYFYSSNELLLTSYWRALLDTDKKRYKLTDYLQLPYQNGDVSLATAYNNIGLFVDDYFADYDKALEYHLKALAIREKVLGTEHPDTAISYNNIGGEYDNKGIYGKALEYYDKALKKREEILGIEHPDTATSYDNIGSIFCKNGDYDKAQKYHFKASTIYEKVLGTEHFSTATSYNNIGGMYKNKGDYDKALEYYKKASAIYEKVLGTEHPDTALSYNNIGGVYKEKIEYDKSLEYFKKGLAIWEKVLGTEHPHIATSYNNIGAVYVEENNYDKALEYYFKALAIREKVLSIKHPDIAISYNNIGVLYYGKGDYDKALEYHFKALDINENVLGTEHPYTAGSYNDIGMIYCDKGNHNKALEYNFKALNIREKVFGSEHPDTATSYNNIGMVYDNLGDYDKALEYYLKSLEIVEEVLDSEHPFTATSYNNIGLVYKEKGDYDKALEYYLKSLGIKENALGTEHPSTSMTYSNIGTLYFNMGKYLEALEYLKKASRIFKDILGDDHPNTKTTQEWIDATKKAMKQKKTNLWKKWLNWIMMI